METVGDTLARIYDELDGIADGEAVTEGGGEALRRAMALISEVSGAGLIEDE